MREILNKRVERKREKREKKLPERREKESEGEAFRSVTIKVYDEGVIGPECKERRFQKRMCNVKCATQP